MSRRLTNIELEQIDEIVERYQAMVADGHDAYAKTGILKDCRIQFTEMAASGDGGPTGGDDGSTIRGYFYRGQPDVFFQRVCERMRWEW